MNIKDNEILYEVENKHTYYKFFNAVCLIIFWLFLIIYPVWLFFLIAFFATLVYRTKCYF